jgi:glucose-6-phosphate 1-dehydrogenase
VEDYQVALATFLAACQRWSGIPITLRQGARVLEDSRRVRVV